MSLLPFWSNRVSLRQLYSSDAREAIIGLESGFCHDDDDDGHGHGHGHGDGEDMDDDELVHHCVPNSDSTGTWDELVRVERDFVSEIKIIFSLQWSLLRIAYLDCHRECSSVLSSRIETTSCNVMVSQREP